MFEVYVWFLLKLEDCQKDRQSLIVDVEALESRINSQNNEEADSQDRLTALTSELNETRNLLNSKDTDSRCLLTYLLLLSVAICSYLHMYFNEW